MNEPSASESPHVAARAYLARVLPRILPPAARVVSLEINAWQAFVHVYLDGSIAEDGSEEEFDRIEAAVAPLKAELPPWSGGDEAWQVLLSVARADVPTPVPIVGELVYVRAGEVIAGSITLP